MVYSVTGTISNNKPKKATTSNTSSSSASNSYLSAIQSLIQQGRDNSAQQLQQTQTIQDQLLKTQKEQTQKVQVQEQQATMESQLAVKDNYASLLQQLITLSQRNAVQNQRMFS